MNILTEMYKEHGIPEATAREMAKSVFRKAELQSPERVVRIEEVRADTMKVVYGRQSSVVSTSDKQAAARQITEQFGIPSGNANDLVEKADEMRAEAIRQRVDAVRASSVSFSAAMNHMTDREQRSIDSMIVCSADDPAKHIVVTGDHNGDRVVHHYAVFNGEQKLGSYSDEHTTDADGQPVRSDDGKTTVWTALKLAAEISELDAKRNALKKTVCELETDALTVTVRKLLLDGKLAPHDVMQLVNEAKQSKSKRKKAETVVTASDTPETEES